MEKVIKMKTEKTQKYRPDTEYVCHCGADYDGSDHCPHCYCERFESSCDVDYNTDKYSEMSDEELNKISHYVSAEMEKRRKDDFSSFRNRETFWSNVNLCFSIVKWSKNLEWEESD